MSPAIKNADSARNLGPMKALGIRIHNLVFTKDSGDDYAEFRVQCEIRLPKPLEAGQTRSPDELKKAQNDADRVAVLLRDVTNPTSLDELERIVTSYIYGPATETFRTTVRSAFIDHRKDLQKRDV
jgi:hypothetical protein